SSTWSAARWGSRSSTSTASAGHEVAARLDPGAGRARRPVRAAAAGGDGGPRGLVRGRDAAHQRALALGAAAERADLGGQRPAVRAGRGADVPAAGARRVPRARGGALPGAAAAGAAARGR